jgi:hypothetical protein
MGKRDSRRELSTVITWQGATAGSLFSIGWAALIGYGFIRLLSSFGANAAELLPQLIWPAIVLALGVPLIVFVWFGGTSIVVGLARLREHL